LDKGQLVEQGGEPQVVDDPIESSPRVFRAE